MSTIRVVNLQHTDATEPNIVLLADGTSVFASGITISGGTNLTVSGTAEFASGTVSAPGITFIDDNNTGLYSPATDTVAITTAATERIRVDSAGSLLLGTSTPSAMGGRLLTVGDTSLSASYIELRTSTAGDGGLLFSDGTIATDSGYRGTIEYSHSVDELFFKTAGTNRMRIDSSGRLLLGTTTVGFNTVDNLTIADSGNCGITIRSGTSSASSIYFADGTSGSAEYEGFIDYQHSTNALRFGSGGGQERMRIDSSGNVGIGTSSPTHQLTVHNASTTAGTIEANRFSARDNYGSASGLGNGIFSPASNTLAFATNSAERMRIFSDGGVNIKKYLEFKNQSDTTQAGYLGNAADLVVSGSANDFALRAEVNLLFSTSGPSERMRIDSAGSLQIAKTAFTSHNTNGHTLDHSGWVHHCASNLAVMYLNRNTSNGNIAEFFVSNSYIGNINYDGTTCTFNNVSDYRLKENVVDITDGIARVKQLFPRRFNFIKNPDTTVDGFIAHEAQAVVPEAVCGEKDGEQMQGIDPSKLVPLLTAALQEAIGEIETLKQRLSDAGIA